MKKDIKTMIVEIENYIGKEHYENIMKVLTENYIPKEEVKKVVEEVEVIRSMIQWDSADEQVYLNGDLEDMRYKLDDLYNSLKKLLEQK